MMLLDVRNLTVGYHTRNGLLKAVQDVSFSLEQGKSIGLVGESGCGKTTLGMALMGLLPPNGSVMGGRILFNGDDLLPYSEQRMRSIRWRDIAMIFQAAMNALNPVHRIDAQIAEAIATHQPDLSEASLKQQVRDLIELVGIPPERVRDFPHQYSGGMKQRAIIAMALANKPRLIIADEPTTALDVIVQDQILKEITRLQHEFAISILFISHDISIMADVCHDIGVMYAGQLVEIGSKTDVFESPHHPYTKALLNSFPALTGDKSKLISIPGETPDLVTPPSGCRFYQRCSLGDENCRTRTPHWVNITSNHKAFCFKA